MAQGDGGGDCAQVVDERQPFGVAAADGERHDAAEPSRQLRDRGFMLVVAGQAGVGHVHDSRVAVAELRDGHGVFAPALRAQREGGGAAHDEPGSNGEMAPPACHIAPVRISSTR